MADSSDDEGELQQRSAIPFLVRANAWLRSRLGRTTELGSALRSSEDGGSTERKAIIRTAPVFAMGQKVYNAREVETIILKTELSQQFSHDIDLAPTEQVHANLKFTPKQKTVIAREYLIRYLENIGAAPTEANIQHLAQHIPPSKVTITHNMQSTGHAKDYVTVTNKLMDNQLVKDEKERPGFLKDGELFTFGIGTLSRKGFKTAQRLNQSWRFGKTDPPLEHEPVPPHHVFQASRNGVAFDPHRTYRHWLEATRPKKRKDSVTMLPTLPVTSEHAKMIRKDVEQNQRGQRSKELAQMADVYYTGTKPVPTLITGELSQPFAFTKQNVVDELALFNRTFPFHEMKSRLSEADIHFAMYEISSARLVNLISKTCRFLYLVVISDERGNNAREKQQGLFTKMQSLYNEQVERMHTRNDVVVVLPLILYAIRVVTEAIFSRVYPRWTLTSEGAATLGEIDRLVQSVFDPSSYHAEIASPYAQAQLKSQTYAQKTVSEAVRTRRKHISAQFRTVSPMVQRLFTNPGSVQTRQFFRDDRKYSTLKPKKGEKSQFYPEEKDAAFLKGTLANGKRNVNRFEKATTQENFLDSANKERLYNLATAKMGRDSNYYETVRARGQREIATMTVEPGGKPWERFGRAKVAQGHTVMEDSDDDLEESISDTDSELSQTDPDRVRLRTKWSTLRSDLLGESNLELSAKYFLQSREHSRTSLKHSVSLRDTDESLRRTSFGTEALSPASARDLSPPHRGMTKSHTVGNVTGTRGGKLQALHTTRTTAGAGVSPTSPRVSSYIQSPSQRSVGVEIASRDPQDHSGHTSLAGSPRVRVEMSDWKPQPPRQGRGAANSPRRRLSDGSNRYLSARK